VEERNDTSVQVECRPRSSSRRARKPNDHLYSRVRESTETRSKERNMRRSKSAKPVSRLRESPPMTAVTARIWRKIDIDIGIGDEIDREGEAIPRLMVTDPVTTVPPMEIRLKPERLLSSSESSSRSLMARDLGSPGGLISRTVPRIINGLNVTNWPSSREL